jgi:hypothetical protein
MTTKADSGYFAKGYAEGQRRVYLAMLKEALRRIGVGLARMGKALLDGRTLGGDRHLPPHLRGPRGQ